jgi:cation transport ATPase
VTDVLKSGTEYDEKDLVRYAGSVEANSEHPIAQGIVRSAGELMPVEEFKAIPGKGAEGKVNGKNVKVVSPGFLRENNLAADVTGIEKLSEQGKTMVFVLIDGKVSGAGTDLAVETADIILVRSNPQDVVTMITLAKAPYRKMVQNLVWASGYNAMAMPLAAGVLYSLGILLSPAMGAVLMSLSTVIVAVNARLLRA